MSTDLQGIRTQIIANAKMMLCPPKHSSSTPPATVLPTQTSNATLVGPTATTSQAFDDQAGNCDMDIVIFGHGSDFTAAIMLGVTPAVEGAPAASPEGAMRRLLLATCELLKTLMPKLGSHQRNIHGGGVFDEDLISPALTEAQKKSS